MKSHFTLMALVFTGTVTSSSPALSQQSAIQAGAQPLPIVLVSDSAIPQRGAMVLQRKQLMPEFVVLVTSKTTAADLAKSIAVIQGTRKKHGTEARMDRAAMVKVAGRSPVSKNIRMAGENLAKLHRAEPRVVAGVGRFPTLLSILPPL